MAKQITMTGRDIAEKQANNLKNSLSYIEQGVRAVTESPTRKAAANIKKMRQNLIAAIDSGKVEAGLNRVSTDDWKNAMITKGINRISEGIDNALPKTTQFFDQLIPHINSGKSKIDQMPNLTITDSGNRMLAWMNHMHSFKRK